MNNPAFGSAPNPGLFPHTSMREMVASAGRFWERRRIAYNLALVALCLGWVAFTWPHFRHALKLPLFEAVLVLAALANVCYCAAYPVDIALQWRRANGILPRGRVWLWWAGTIFAVLLAYYWIGDEFYPYV